MLKFVAGTRAYWCSHCVVPSHFPRINLVHFFSTSRDDSEILEFHNIPALVVDVYCAIFIELAAMLVLWTPDGAPNCLYACINMEIEDRTKKLEWNVMENGLANGIAQFL